MMRAAEKFPSSLLSVTMPLVIKCFYLSVSFLGHPFLDAGLGDRLFTPPCWAILKTLLRETPQKSSTLHTESPQT